MNLPQLFRIKVTGLLNLNLTDKTTISKDDSLVEVIYVKLKIFG